MIGKIKGWGSTYIILVRSGVGVSCGLRSQRACWLLSVIFYGIRNRAWGKIIMPRYLGVWVPRYKYIHTYGYRSLGPKSDLPFLADLPSKKVSHFWADTKTRVYNQSLIHVSISYGHGYRHYRVEYRDYRVLISSMYHNHMFHTSCIIDRPSILLLHRWSTICRYMYMYLYSYLYSLCYVSYTPSYVTSRVIRTVCTKAVWDRESLRGTESQKQYNDPIVTE